MLFLVIICDGQRRDYIEKPDPVKTTLRPGAVAGA